MKERRKEGERRLSKPPEHQRANRIEANAREQLSSALNLYSRKRALDLKGKTL